MSNCCTKAFIGVSLDSKLFTREWVRMAIHYIMMQNSHLVFLLADDLLPYTRSLAIEKSYPILDFVSIWKKSAQIAEQKNKFLVSEIERLSFATQKRVKVVNWAYYSDSTYARILRRLRIAFEVIDSFRETITDVALQHRTKLGNPSPNMEEKRASTAFLLDEIAMCLRVSEVEGYANEYSPYSDMSAIRDLYSGKFVSYGLSIDNIVDKKARRVFKTLELSPKNDSIEI